MSFFIQGSWFAGQNACERIPHACERIPHQICDAFVNDWFYFVIHIHDKSLDFASNHAGRWYVKKCCPAEGSFVLLMEQPCLGNARKELIELLQHKGKDSSTWICSRKFKNLSAVITRVLVVRFENRLIELKSLWFRSQQRNGGSLGELYYRRKYTSVIF